MQYPARLLFRIEREIKSLPEKQKPEEFTTTKAALQKMLKSLLYAEKQSHSQK